MRINEIWQELEDDNSFSNGILYRRYSASILPDVFIALQNPEKFRCIAASIDQTIPINISYLSSLKDINIEVRLDENRPQRKVLLFRLINNQHSDIFSVLCEDLIASIANITDEKQLIKELFNRFEKWKSLFDRASSLGLNPEEQRGLFGELLFMREFHHTNGDYLNIINSWIGPERQIRDFQHAKWGVEVKTTHGNNHQKIQIANERQLDTSNLNDLILYHISLESRQNTGESLNQVVDSIIDILRHDFTSLNRFKNKLLEGGYFEQHRQLYEDKGYIIRADTYYKVKDDFPRIEEKDIRRGVGDVNYTIILSNSTAYVINKHDVFSFLNFNE